MLFATMLMIVETTLTRLAATMLVNVSPQAPGQEDANKLVSTSTARMEATFVIVYLASRSMSTIPRDAWTLMSVRIGARVIVHRFVRISMALTGANATTVLPLRMNIVVSVRPMIAVSASRMSSLPFPARFEAMKRVKSTG